MNSSSVSKAIVERFIATCNGDNDADAWRQLVPTPVITVAGSTWFSGRFEGEAQVRRILLETLRHYLRAPRVRILDLIAEGAHVAALIEVSGATRDGRSFAVAGAPWGVSFELAADRIASIDVFPDTMFVEMTLCGAVYEPNDPSRVLA